MAKKKIKYTPMMGREFLRLCSEGKSVSQISDLMKVPKERFKEWIDDPRNFEFQKVWEAGKTACQAYHETLLESMIRNGASGPVIEAQKYILRVRFKEDWSEKQESKLEISHINQLSDQELQARLEKMLVRPTIRSLYSSEAVPQDEETGEILQDEEDIAEDGI